MRFRAAVILNTLGALAAVALAGCGSGGSSSAFPVTSGNLNEGFDAGLTGTLAALSGSSTPTLDSVNGNPPPSIQFPSGGTLETTSDYTLSGGATFSADVGFFSPGSTSDTSVFSVISNGQPLFLDAVLNIIPQGGSYVLTYGTPQGSYTNSDMTSTISNVTAGGLLPSFTLGKFHTYQVRIDAKGGVQVLVDGQAQGSGLPDGTVQTSQAALLLLNSQASSVRFDNVQVTHP